MMQWPTFLLLLLLFFLGGGGGGGEGGKGSCQLLCPSSCPVFMRSLAFAIGSRRVPHAFVHLLLLRGTRHSVPFRRQTRSDMQHRPRVEPRSDSGPPLCETLTDERQA